MAQKENLQMTWEATKHRWEEGHEIGYVRRNCGIHGLYDEPGQRLR